MAKKAPAPSYTSKPHSPQGSFSGIRDTSAGKIPESTGQFGTVQSGNNNRGGPTTKNYDSTVDRGQTYEAPGLAELRRKQDARQSRGG